MLALSLKLGEAVGLSGLYAPTDLGVVRTGTILVKCKDIQFNFVRFAVETRFLTVVACVVQGQSIELRGLFVNQAAHAANGLRVTLLDIRSAGRVARISVTAPDEIDITRHNAAGQRVGGRAQPAAGAGA
jgi:hypothetical protein